MMKRMSCDTQQNGLKMPQQGDSVAKLDER